MTETQKAKADLKTVHFLILEELARHGNTALLRQYIRRIMSIATQALNAPDAVAENTDITSGAEWVRMNTVDEYHVEVSQ